MSSSAQSSIVGANLAERDEGVKRPEAGGPLKRYPIKPHQPTASYSWGGRVAERAGAIPRVWIMLQPKVRSNAIAYGKPVSGAPASPFTR